METYNLSHFPAPYSTVHIALFENVRNSPDIRKRLIAASVAEGPEGEAARADIDFGFVEGRLIVSREHLMVAIMATLLTSLATSTSDSSPVLKTRSHNLHSEILLALSPNNNISDSIRRHGIASETDHLVVVRFGGDGSQEDVEAVWRGMAEVVDGDLVSLDKLDQGEQIDWSRIDKIFKLSEIDRLPLTETEKHAKKVAAIISTVAVKHVT